MNSEKKVKEVFRKTLDIPEDYEIKKSSSFNNVPGWDSLGHMQIVSELENVVGESLDMEEIVDLDRVDKIIKLVEKKDGKK